MNVTNPMASKLEDALLEPKPTLAQFFEAGQDRSEETMMAVALVRKHIGDKANIVQIEAQTNPALINKYHMHAYPTWVMFVDGQEAWRTTGRLGEKELEDMIKRFE